MNKLVWVLINTDTGLPVGVAEDISTIDAKINRLFSERNMAVTRQSDTDYWNNEIVSYTAFIGGNRYAYTARQTIMEG